MHEDGIPSRMTSTDATRRMVCHACGERLPIGAVTSASVQCCPRPDWHVHDTAQPCTWCADYTPEQIVQAAAGFILGLENTHGRELFPPEGA